MPRQGISSDRIAPPIGPFSSGVVSGGRFYSSGQVAIDPASGLLVEGDATVQTEHVFYLLGCVLEAAGRSFADVIKANVYLADMDDFAAMNAVYERHFEQPFPARTTIQAARLPLGARVEIEIIAE